LFLFLILVHFVRYVKRPFQKKEAFVNIFTKASFKQTWGANFKVFSIPAVFSLSI